MEDELGVPIFDRLPSGVRLSVAGELFIHHVRKQLSDLQRVKSQIADLAGERRGHISIVCGQALMNSFMPEMIAQYQLEHPAVTFDIQVCSRHDVEEALSDYSADIALIFEPRLSKDFHCVIDVPQPLQMVCVKGHPLAGRAMLRLSECAEYPMALPTRANGVRHLLEQAAVRMSLNLPVMIESNSQTMIHQSLLHQDLLTFQIPLGMGPEGEHSQFQQSAIDGRDIGEGRLYLGHLKGRNLPVASARFLEQLAGALDQRFGDEK